MAVHVWRVLVVCRNKNALAWADHLIIELKFALGKVHSHEIADKNNTRDNKNIFLTLFLTTILVMPTVSAYYEVPQP